MSSYIVYQKSYPVYCKCVYVIYVIDVIECAMCHVSRVPHPVDHMSCGKYAA